MFIELYDLKRTAWELQLLGFCSCAPLEGRPHKLHIDVGIRPQLLDRLKKTYQFVNASSAKLVGLNTSFKWVMTQTMCKIPTVTVTWLDLRLLSSHRKRQWECSTLNEQYFFGGGPVLLVNLTALATLSRKSTRWLPAQDAQIMACRDEMTSNDITWHHMTSNDITHVLTIILIVDLSDLFLAKGDPPTIRWQTALLVGLHSTLFDTAAIISLLL